MTTLPDGYAYYRGRRCHHIRRRGQLRALCGVDALAVHRLTEYVQTCKTCQRALDRQRAFVQDTVQR